MRGFFFVPAHALKTKNSPADRIDVTPGFLLIPVVGASA